MSTKATETKLNKLHGAVADVLTEMVTEEENVTTFDTEGNEVPTGDVRLCASPALLATACKFLKDNNITADIEQNENMGNLRDALSAKQKRSRMSAAEAATSMEVTH